jgi:hypothetical protein
VAIQDDAHLVSGRFGHRRLYVAELSGAQRAIHVGLQPFPKERYADESEAQRVKVVHLRGGRVDVVISIGVVICANGHPIFAAGQADSYVGKSGRLSRNRQKQRSGEKEILEH